MNVWHALPVGERLWRILCPGRCLLCHRVVTPHRLFCRTCQASLPEKPVSREMLLPRDPQGQLWGEDGRLWVLAPFPYRQGLADTLHRLKFQQETSLALPLGWVMAETAGTFLRPFHGVTYVPMSPEKRRRRGYNQSQLLAKSLAKELDLPCWDLLEQVRETATQHELSRAERADNVRGAYRARPTARGKDLLLVDDIVTTGATLRACALALYEAGARQVCGLCAAGTAWEPGREEEEIPQGEP